MLLKSIKITTKRKLPSYIDWQIKIFKKDFYQLEDELRRSCSRWIQTLCRDLQKKSGTKNHDTTLQNWNKI